MLNQLRRYCVEGFSKKLVIAAGVVGALGAMSSSASAQILPDFQVNTGAIPGSPSVVFTADKITGNYNEVLTITGPGTFSTLAYWDAGQFVANDGTTVVSGTFLGCGEGVNAGCYNIYGLFQSTGTFAPDGSGGFDFTGGTGSIQLWADPLENGNPKTLPATGTGPLSSIGVPNTGDDILLATAALIAGAGQTGGPAGQRRLRAAVRAVRADRYRLGLLLRPESVLPGRDSEGSVQPLRSVGAQPAYQWIRRRLLRPGP